MKALQINQKLELIILSIALAVSSTAFHSVRAEYHEDIPEIGWNSRLSSMGLDEEDNIGKEYTFYCQPSSEKSIHAPVWGTDVYTANSGICSTAVHFGMISSEGGEVTVKLLEGKNFYTGSDKNDVASRDYRGTDFSFTFVGEIAEERSNFESSKKKGEPSGIQRIFMDGVQRGVEKTVERTIIDFLN